MRSPITLVGVALIVLGIVAFAYQGVTYTSREKIIDIGPFQATDALIESDDAPLCEANDGGRERVSSREAMSALIV